MIVQETTTLSDRRRFQLLAGGSGHAELADAGVRLEGTARLWLAATGLAAWTALHDRALSEARAAGASRVIGVVREDDPAADRFRAAGYSVGWRTWGATLRLPDNPDWTSYDAAVQAEVDIGEVTAAEVDVAYELYARVAGDVPFTPATGHEVATREAFSESVPRDRVFAAFAEGRCVSLTVGKVDGESIDSGITATAPESRGQGLARATKAVMIRTLHAEGVRVFTTGGAEENLPMRAVNLALGYEFEPWWLTFVREL